MQANSRTIHEQEAYELGVADAIAAASWVIDGNTPLEAIRRTIALLDAGDDIDPYLPATPNLSGEWADDRTPISLYEEITGNSHGIEEDNAGLAYEASVGSVVDALCDAYEEGVSSTFVSECERILREAIS